MPWPVKSENSKPNDLDTDSDISSDEAIDTIPETTQKKTSQQQIEEMENWLSMNDIDDIRSKKMPKATSSDVGAFIESGEIFAYAFSLLPEPLQAVLNRFHGVFSKIFRITLGILWAIFSVIFNIITNALPYMLLTLTTLSQSNELLTRGILLGVVKSDKKISEILKDRKTTRFRSTNIAAHS